VNSCSGGDDFLQDYVLWFSLRNSLREGAIMLNPELEPEPAKSTPTEGLNKTPLPALTIVCLRQPKLNLGRIVITSNADAVLSSDDVNAALRRHSFRDWGVVCAEDWNTNDHRCRDQ